MAYQKLQASTAVAIYKSDDANIPNPGAQTITGSITSVSANKLVDSAAPFADVKVGDIVFNTTAGTSATVTAVDSTSQLTLNADIFTVAAQSYTVYTQQLDLLKAGNGCVLYVGVSGDLKVITAAGNEVLFVGVPVGFFPVQVNKVLSTGTAADSVVALW
jgi:limonene-1,2-epoxide hydrolase